MWKIIDGEAVVIHSDSSEYFGLNASGTALWQILANSMPSSEQLAHTLVIRFERESATATEEVAAFIAKGRDVGLISEAPVQPADDRSETGVVEMASVPSGPYEPPEIVKFGDLATLVLSGE